MQIVIWNALTETLDKPTDFCSCCTLERALRPGVYQYRCHGHMHPNDLGLPDDAGEAVPDEAIGGEAAHPEEEAEGASPGDGAVLDDSGMPDEFLKSEVLHGSQSLILELGAGCAELSLALDNILGPAGSIAAVPVDRTAGALRQVTPLLYLDLAEEYAQEVLVDVVKRGKVVHVHMSCPADTLERERGDHAALQGRRPR